MAVPRGVTRQRAIIAYATLEETVTVTEPFRVARNSDAPWVMLADGSMTGGSVSFGEARLPPRTSGPSYHVHENEDEAAYVVDGTMTFRVGDETFEAGPGTLVWLPRGVPHTFANLSDRSVWAFGTITPAGLEGMFAEQAEYFASLTGPPDESRIDEIGARWGVTRVGPPLQTPGGEPPRGNAGYPARQNRVPAPGSGVAAGA